MTIGRGLFGALSLLLFAGFAPVQDAAGVVAELQGTWTISSVNGQPLSSLGQKSSMTFKSDTYSVTTDGQVKEQGTYKIDAKKKPMEIDMKITQGIAAGNTQIGLIQIVNGILTLKTNTVGMPKRPVDFKAEPWYVLIVAKKN
jgi:uncharacterized protein (TIGR03067 family)